MIGKKLLPVAAVVFMAGVLVSGSCKGNNDNDSLYKQQQLLVGVGIFMQRYHYSPKPYDDKFSESVFNDYLGKRLDPEKAIFLKKDIDSLSQYKYTLDDELRGDIPLRFYPSALSTFRKRLKEVEAITDKLLSKPFTFTANETLQTDRDSADFPVNEAEREDLWRKRIKYQVLTKYYDLYTQREKANATDSIRKKTDAQLEKEAREKVVSSMQRYFKRFAPGAFEETKQFSNYLNAIADQQDPHTEYMAPLDKADFDAQMSNKIIGIGAQLKEDNGEIKIVSVVVGGPAWKTKKVQANDIITKVSTGTEPFTDLTGYDINDAIKLIRGVKGSRVNIVLKKTTGVTDTVSMIREEINVDEASARSLVINNQGKKIGYLYLPEFYADFQDPSGSRIAKDVKTEIEKLKAEGIEGMIVDLRTNPGGSLFDVNQIIGYFVKPGPVVQVKNRQGKTQDLKNGSNEQPIYDGPLAVMINEMSASASEIFAAAIQDYKRGLVIGSTSTYGKGTVQRAIPLGNDDPKTGQPEFGSLKLTIEKFYRINGTSNQRNGVASDIVLPDILETLKIREKDQPTALSWDKIAPAKFAPWQVDYNFPAVISSAKERISHNNAFNQIKKTSDWMGENQDRPADLNFDKYKAYQLETKKILNTDDSLTKLKVPMDVTVLKPDRPKFYENKDKSKQDFYQRWLDDISKDIYIDETSRVVYDMINRK